jgi:hypothetical protein
MKEEGIGRRTPYELVFDAQLEARFDGIREEAEARGERLTAPEGFLLLGDVGALLQDLLPEGDAAAAAAAGDYGILLYHAFQFRRFGKWVLAVSAETCRRLATLEQAIGRWDLVPPEPAGYLQLPRHLFWAAAAEGDVPEPVDGIFWAVVGEEDPKVPPYGRLDLLLVLGVRRDRPGFSVAAVHEVWPASGDGHWGDARARTEGEDFANVLPGGDLDQLLALTTPLEALKLVSRTFWCVAEAAPPDAVLEIAASAEPDGTASALPYRLLRWHAANG